MRCPICHKATDLSRSNPFPPFCSERCRDIDLGKWAGENYRIEGGKVEDRDDPDDTDDLKKKKLLN
jgi:endogenous inhibitor of DNA gyrase (YacG/DUF329 family)